jgi:hypothetical protein
LWDKESEGALFTSRKGRRPLSRVQAYRILNEAAKQIGIKEAIGTQKRKQGDRYAVLKQGTCPLFSALFSVSSHLILYQVKHRGIFLGPQLRTSLPREIVVELLATYCKGRQNFIHFSTFSHLFKNSSLGS